MSSGKILLTDVRSPAYDAVISHVWVNDSKRIGRISLKSGDVISFDVCSCEIVFIKLYNKIHRQYFYGKSEPEAIFKACQWILDNGDKNV